MNGDLAGPMLLETWDADNQKTLVPGVCEQVDGGYRLRELKEYDEIERWYGVAVAIINTVHIVETTVLNVKAYRAHCADCEWKCHKTPHDEQDTAVSCGERHLVRKHP